MYNAEAKICGPKVQICDVLERAEKELSE